MLIYKGSSFTIGGCLELFAPLFSPEKRGTNKCTLGFEKVKKLKSDAGSSAARQYKENER